MKRTRKRLAPSIETFSGGVRITGLRGNGRGGGNVGKRGKIKGWSKDSRKRMREFLLIHQPVEGLKSYGITLTVPGPSLEPEHARRLWDHFGKNYLVRNGCGAVWRLEVQTRGQVHWHALMVGRPKIGGVRIEELVRAWWLKSLDILPPWYVHSSGFAESIEPPVSNGCIRHYAGEGIERVWWDVSRYPAAKAARPLPPSMEHLKEAFDFVQSHSVLFGGRVVVIERKEDAERTSLKYWPGAWKFAVDVQGGGGRGSWMRYLQDHATKAKQEQIAEGYGRHWGVVGREKFIETLANGEMVFSSQASYARFWRAYHRLTRPVMSHRVRRGLTGNKFDRRPFAGKSLGWSSNRGVYGVSCWYSRPETVEKIFRWAESVL